MNKILLTILLFILGINLTYSQYSVLEQTMNISAKDIPLKEILSQISEQTKYFFTYNPDFVSEEKRIRYFTKNTSIKHILNDIISDSTLTFNVIEDHIVICKKAQNLPSLISSKKSVNNLIEISGKITDSKSGKVIPFASVGILNTTIGTVSNENGFFHIKIEKVYIDSILFVANLGYITQFVSVAESVKYERKYRLVKDIVSIQEVIIRTHDPISLLENAHYNIRNNYIQKPSVLTAFYREGVEKKGNIKNLSEAVLRIYKAPYKTSIFSDKIKVEKSRKIINTEFSDTLSLKLKDGLYSSLSLDIVKYPISFFNKTNMDKYNYQTNNIVTYGEKEAYVVSFIQKNNINEVLYKGEIYIETKTYAIIACDFEFNFKVSGTKPNFVSKKKRKQKLKTISAKYHLNYRSVNNTYFLNHVRADIEFKAKSRKQLFYSKYNVFIETVILDIDTIKIEKFQKKDIEKKNKIFIDNSYTYDSNFWGDNNFIKPEKSIEEAIKKIKVKLEYSIK